MSETAVPPIKKSPKRQWVGYSLRALGILALFILLGVDDKHLGFPGIGCTRRGSWVRIGSTVFLQSRPATVFAEAKLSG